MPFNFLALPEEQSRRETARVVILPVPYDSTTSFKSGARDGPTAIIQASHNLEDYDPELEADVAQVGIYTAPWLEPHMEGPRHMVERVREAVSRFLTEGKLVAMLGGEHSITVGAIRAMADWHPDLSVLYLDAHADMRDEYMGTGWGHASAARRISEICPLVEVGIRSLSFEEMQFIRESGIQAFFCPPMTLPERSLQSGNPEVWSSSLPHSGPPGPVGQLNVNEIIGHLSPDVYVSIDLDVLDPAIMSAVGTPEPGGMDWHQITSLLRAVGEERRIVGFDVVELSPGEGPSSCAYSAAKLVYKLLAYSTVLAMRRDEPGTLQPRL